MNFNRVFFRSLDDAVPVYHLIPDWHRGEGCRGGDVVCNTIVITGTNRALGSNSGVPLPRSVVAPCGVCVYRRRPVIERSLGVTPQLETLNASSMVAQGDLIPRKHAEKFGRPCRKCFP